MRKVSLWGALRAWESALREVKKSVRVSPSFDSACDRRPSVSVRWRHGFSIRERASSSESIDVVRFRRSARTHPHHLHAVEGAGEHVHEEQGENDEPDLPPPPPLARTPPISFPPCAASIGHRCTGRAAATVGLPPAASEEGPSNRGPMEKTNLRPLLGRCPPPASPVDTLQFATAFCVACWAGAAGGGRGPS